MSPIRAGARCALTMRRYIRAHRPGATYFFTLTLQDRSARYLVDHAATLRSCLRTVMERHQQPRFHGQPNPTNSRIQDQKIFSGWHPLC